MYNPKGNSLVDFVFKLLILISLTVTAVALVVVLLLKGYINEALFVGSPLGVLIVMILQNIRRNRGQQTHQDGTVTGTSRASDEPGWYEEYLKSQTSQSGLPFYDPEHPHPMFIADDEAMREWLEETRRVPKPSVDDTIRNEEARLREAMRSHGRRFHDFDE
jgi:hypothetical protein